jgi:trimeric autotransporter adhesin
MLNSRRKVQACLSFTVLFLLALALGCNGFFVDPVLQTITVTPPTPGILVGQTQQMTATGTYDDGSTKTITGSVSWSTTDASVATVTTSGGLVTGVSSGTASIQATSATISGSTSVTVSLSGVTSITVTPSSQSVSASSGTAFCLQALATTSGGQVDISSTATWAFTDPNGAAESGITKTTGSCTGQAFLIGTLTPTGPPTVLKATASAPGSNNTTVTSPAVTVGVTK